MPPHISHRVFVVLASACAAVSLLGSSAYAATAAPGGTPTATHFGGVSFVGALFPHGTSNAHGCSATVVSSPAGNLVLTAAHCVLGTGTNLQFAPGYVNGRTPYGVWSVTRVYVSRNWVGSRDPDDDYAFLMMARLRGKRLQDVTGAATLGTAVANKTRVTDIAYTRGINDKPITCAARIVYTKEYPTFNCHGYYNGTSGSPFLVTAKNGSPVVVGVIGGYHQGGCTEWNSFSSPFDRDPQNTYHRAASNWRSDTVPAPGGDGC